MPRELVVFDVPVQSPSGTNIQTFFAIQAQPNGTFQLFASNLPSGLLNVLVLAGSKNMVVQPGSNVLNTIPFMQMACAGTHPFISVNPSTVIVGTSIAFQGSEFTPGSMLTISARSTNGTLLGSTTVTGGPGPGSISGTLSTMGFPIGQIPLVVTLTGSTTVLALSTANIVQVTCHIIADLPNSEPPHKVGWLFLVIAWKWVVMNREEPLPSEKL